nr:hypothetical protein [Tanacetum cinerariifolium]
PAPSSHRGCAGIPPGRRTVRSRTAGNRGPGACRRGATSCGHLDGKTGFRLSPSAGRSDWPVRLAVRNPEGRRLLRTRTGCTV